MRWQSGLKFPHIQETFGAMAKTEKIDFVLEQVRLCLERKDFIRYCETSKHCAASKHKHCMQASYKHDVTALLVLADAAPLLQAKAEIS